MTGFTRRCCSQDTYKRSEAAPSINELKKLRSKIEDFQKGRIAGSKIPKNQWPLIWFRYKKRAEQLRAA